MRDLSKTKSLPAGGTALLDAGPKRPGSQCGGQADGMSAWNKFQRYKRLSLDLSAGTRIGMTVSVSLVCLYLAHTLPLWLLFAASAAYLCLEVKFGLVWKVYALLAVLAVIAALCLMVLFHIFPAMEASGRNMGVAAPFLRLGIMVNMVLAMGMNTSLTGLTNTLSKACLPGFIKLPLIILVRFVPTFFCDMQQLREAVRIRFRGQGGFRFWLRHPVLWSRILFMPLIVRLIRSGDELAVAAELKGLSTKTRFSEEPVRITRTDGLALGVLVIVLAAAVVLYEVLKHA